MNKNNFSIINLFPDKVLKKKGDGNYKTVCPQCGLQGGRTEGFILFPESNMWYCHSSGKHGGILELVALQNNIINCIDCLEKGEKRRILEAEQFKEVLDLLKNKYGWQTYKGVCDVLKLRQPIQLPNNGKLISTFADELCTRIKNENYLFYRSDTKEIVEIGKIKHPSGECEYRGFVPLTSNRFITFIEKYFKPWQEIYTKQGKKIVNKSMPGSVGSVVLVSDNFIEQMPVINRIFTIQQPIIYKGKLTFPEKGYDIRFGSWLPYNAPSISKPEMSLKEGKEIISYIFNEFCFQSKQDYTNAIASLLTPLLRGLYKTGFSTRTPFVIYEANRERAGKDYAAGITGIVTEGVALEEPPISNNERSNGNNDEIRKKILSAMIAGRKRLHFANNKGNLNNAVFEAYLTAKKISDRLLGTNKNIDLNNEIEYSGSGNIGMTMTPDLANRSIFVKLFLDVEDANSRKFNNANLHKWVLDNRELVLSALYSLIRNWFDNKCPKGSLPFTSYPEWAETCGGIMECAGYDNPCVRDKEMLGVAVDSETSDMKSLFELCFESNGEEWMNKKDIVKLISESEDSLFSYYDFEKNSDQVKFAKKFDKFIGRIFSDVRLVVDDMKIRASRRKYKFTAEKSTFDKKEVFGSDFNVENIEKVAESGRNGRVGRVCLPPSDSLYIRKMGSSENPANPTKNANFDKKAIKNDRQVQFWEAPECDTIKEQCTKEEVFSWCQKNPKHTFEEMFDKLGHGSPKHYNELKSEVNYHVRSKHFSL